MSPSNNDVSESSINSDLLETTPGISNNTPVVFVSPSSNDVSESPTNNDLLKSTSDTSNNTPVVAVLPSNNDVSEPSTNNYLLESMNDLHEPMNNDPPVTNKEPNSPLLPTSCDPAVEQQVEGTNQADESNSAKTCTNNNRKRRMRVTSSRSKKKINAIGEKGGKMLRKRHVKHIRKDQQTLIMQMRDMDNKIEEMHCAITKLNIQEVLENLLTKTENTHTRLTNSSTQTTADTENTHTRLTNSSTQTTTTAETCVSPTNNATSTISQYEMESTTHEQFQNDPLLVEALSTCKASVVSLESQVSILEGEINNKSKEIQRLHTENLIEAQRAASVSTLKTTLDRANSEIGKFMAKETEWDLHMAKRGNEIQELKLENLQLQKRIDDKIFSKRTNNQRNDQQNDNAKTNNTNMNIPDNSNKPNKLKVVPDPPPPDVYFMHDSLGHKIKEGILSKQNLITQKLTTYYVEDALKGINELKTDNPPKVFVLHSGTNNLKTQTPEEVLPLYEKLVHRIRSKFPGSKLVYSSVVPREDNRDVQLNVNYLNAAFHRKYGRDKDIFVINKNSDIRGFRLKRRDGIHLTDEGTSCLARHIRDGVKAILNIP